MAKNRFLDDIRAVGLRVRRTVIPNMIRDRLKTYGTYADGTPIKTYASVPPLVYARSTIYYKRAAGQPTEHVTLRDTGAFYRSIRVESAGAGGQIIGDTDKFSKNLNPKNILEITDENALTIEDYIADELENIFNRNADDILREP